MQVEQAYNLLIMQIVQTILHAEFDGQGVPLFHANRNLTERMTNSVKPCRGGVSPPAGRGTRPLQRKTNKSIISSLHVTPNSSINLCIISNSRNAGDGVPYEKINCEIWFIFKTNLTNPQAYGQRFASLVRVRVASGNL